MRLGDEMANCSDRYHLVPYAMGGIPDTGTIIAMSRWRLAKTAPLIAIGAGGHVRHLPASPISSSFPFLSFEWLNASFSGSANADVSPGRQPERDLAEKGGGDWPGADRADSCRSTAVAIVFRYRIRKGLQVVEFASHVHAIAAIDAHAERRPAREFSRPDHASGAVAAARTDFCRRGGAQGGSETTAISLSGTARPEGNQSAGPERIGYRANRPLRMRQEHAPAVLQPDARLVSRHPLMKARSSCKPMRLSIFSARRSIRWRCGCGTGIGLSKAKSDFLSRSLKTFAYGLRLRLVSKRAVLEEKVRAGVGGGRALGRS
jgi:hypothetical protein